ncbi:MAG: uroporphyrinogen decarboxylase [Deltaproteobacteria bacterium]|nr:uroporphyrinogen decarboxylase [Deltaproteobacteria bacterium]
MASLMTSRDRFLAAFAGAPLDRPPLWLMRQAGRYLPDYRAVRAQHGFWEVCKTPALATRVALEPLALFPLDAAIVFSDILTVPDALGLDVTFGTGDGPRVGRPLKSAADLEQWDVAGAPAKLAFAADAVTDLRRAIGERALLGFCGSPWTLLCYAAEGQGSDDFRAARTLLLKDPALARRAMEAFADVAAGLLRAQLAAGADAVQIFDTWGGLLPRELYRAHVVPMIRRIVEQLPSSSAGPARSILFVRGGQHLLPVLGESGVAGLSLDWRTPWREARALYPRLVLQGNVDPITLLAGPDAAAAEARALVADMRADDGGRRCIANLGHGILPPTTVESVAALCRAVTEVQWSS